MDYALITALSVNTITFIVGASNTWPSPVLEKLFKGGEDSPLDHPIALEEGPWISALLNLGGVTSPFLYGYLMDKIGRKHTILLSGIPMLMGYLIMILISKTIISYYIGRFLIGFSIGGLFNVIPVYVAEISPRHNRGFVSSMLNLFFSSGMMFSYCIGPYISITTFNSVLLVFPVIFFVSFPVIGEESPYYYIRKGRTDSAREVFRKIRKYSLNIDQEFREICKTTQGAQNESFFGICRNVETRKALAITMGLICFQQFSGIMAVVSCTQNIFEQAGVELDSAICSIMIGAVQVILALTTPLTIDKYGRKILLIISSIGAFLSMFSLGVFTYFREKGYDLSSISTFPLIFLMIYMVTYNIGLGPLPIIVSAEVLPSNVRASASSALLSVSLLEGFFVVKYFKTVTLSIGMGAVFLIFAGFCGFSILFAHFVMIETKGKSLEQITKELSR